MLKEKKSSRNKNHSELKLLVHEETGDFVHIDISDQSRYIHLIFI